MVSCKFTVAYCPVSHNTPMKPRTNPQWQYLCIPLLQFPHFKTGIGWIFIKMHTVEVIVNLKCGIEDSPITLGKYVLCLKDGNFLCILPKCQ